MIKRIRTRKSKPIKSYEIFFDPTSERFVFEIQDFDGLFPLLIKGDEIERVYELKHTKNGKLQIV